MDKYVCHRNNQGMTFDIRLFPIRTSLHTHTHKETKLEKEGKKKEIQRSVYQNLSAWYNQLQKNDKDCNSGECLISGVSTQQTPGWRSSYCLINQEQLRLEILTFADWLAPSSRHWRGGGLDPSLILQLVQRECIARNKPKINRVSSATWRRDIAKAIQYTNREK